MHSDNYLPAPCSLSFDGLGNCSCARLPTQAVKKRSNKQHPHTYLKGCGGARRFRSRGLFDRFILSSGPRCTTGRHRCDDDKREKGEERLGRQASILLNFGAAASLKHEGVWYNA